MPAVEEMIYREAEKPLKEAYLQNSQQNKCFARF